MGYEVRNWFVFMVLFSCLVYSSYCYEFVVGGKDGWVVKPSENYNEWASRMRFQVNDSIVFKYKSGSDSVLVVNKGDYDSCNVANPMLKLDDGNSVFKFNRSGPFYFISGNKPNCDQGQKLIVVVLSPRTPPTPSTPLSPPGGAPVPAGSPLSPGGGSPLSPGGAPVPGGSPLSPSGAPVPAGSPLSPGGGSPVPAGGAPLPAGDLPGSPGSATPADANSPPRSFAAPPCSASVLLISLLSLGLGGLLFSP